MTEEKDNLEAFAKRIETRIRKSKGTDDGMEQLICRILTGSDRGSSTKLAERWVEWRYGKAKQPVVGADGGAIAVAHTIKFGDGEDSKDAER